MGEWTKGDYYMPPNDEDILMYYEPHRVTEFYCNPYNPIVTEWDIYADGGYYNTTKDTPPKPPKEFTVEENDD